jgi:hypothetical protein
MAKLCALVKQPNSICTSIYARGYDESTGELLVPTQPDEVTVYAGWADSWVAFLERCRTLRLIDNQNRLIASYEDAVA